MNRLLYQASIRTIQDFTVMGSGLTPAIPYVRSTMQANCNGEPNNRPTVGCTTYLASCGQLAVWVQHACCAACP